jgi:hypothetical protein
LLAPSHRCIVTRKGNRIETQVIGTHYRGNGSFATLSGGKLLEHSPFVVTFPDATSAEANVLAGTFIDAVRELDRGIAVNRAKGRPDTQDLGAIVTLMLGTAAVTAVAKGISAWLARNSGTRIEIWYKGELVIKASHLESTDAAKIVKALSSGQ